MNEALRNLTVLLWALTAVNTNSYAQANVVSVHEEAVDEVPTIIYGASKKSSKESDEVLIDEPASAGNVMGAPIVDEDNNNLEENPFSAQVEPVSPVTPPPALNPVKEVQSNTPPVTNNQNSKYGPNQIDNTLYESGDRIYDLQSYPVKDVNEITQPNTQPTISNY